MNTPYRSRPVVSCWRALVVAATVISTSLVQGQTTDGAPGLGLRPPTEEERGWMEQRMQNTKAVRLNALGLARINTERRDKRLPEFTTATTVPVGDEPMPQSETPRAGALEGKPDAPQAMAPIGLALPSGVDNSTLAAFPPVESQGSLNSCAAFSTTYYVGTHMTGIARGWSNNNSDTTRKFSAKWTYNFVNGGENAGLWFTSVFDVLLKLGAATANEWPYSGTTATVNYREWPRTASVWRNAVNNRFNSVGRVQAIDTDPGL
ncbi:MAG: hypothetical protein ACTS6J_24685, partial [Burkholderiales bacterium]